MKKKLIILATLITIAFSGTISSSFVWDDHGYIEYRDEMPDPSIKNILNGTHPIKNTGVYRPVRNLLYPITHVFFKTNPTPYHVLILLIHIANTFLVLKISQKITNNNTASFVTSLIFALHPIHTEPIAWITAGFDLFSVLFYLMSLLFFIRKEDKESNYMWSMIFGFLSIFSNETSSTLPITLFLYEALFNKGFKISNTFKKVYPYITMLGIFWLIRSQSITVFAEEKGGVYDNIFQSAVLVLFLFGQYIKLLILPLNLSVDRYFFPRLTGYFATNYGGDEAISSLNIYNPDVWQNILLVILWTVGLFFARRKSKKIFFSLLFIFIGLIPVIQIIPIYTIFTERYAYLSSLGFSLIAGILISKLFSIKKAKIATKLLLISLLGSYFFIISQRIPDWKNDLTLFNKTIAQNPESTSALNALGVYYDNLKKPTLALYYFEEAYSQAPHVYTYQKNALRASLKAGEFNEALDYINKILEDQPDAVDLLVMSAKIYEGGGDFDRARENYLKALEYVPDNEDVRFALEKIDEDN
ncbi:tetratricopeptide repeat protein [Patescibacteria group bacterium]